MPCEKQIASGSYADFISPYYTAPDAFAASVGTDCIDFINGQYAVLYYPLDSVGPPMISTHTYSAIPKLYSTQDFSAMDAAGILTAGNLPALRDAGEGVLIGFVDTGIDYRLPAFRNADGSTRILGIWDQTADPSSAQADEDPNRLFHPLYGVQYTKAQIDDALKHGDPSHPVPAPDENGHGTFLASLAAGTPDPDAGFTGAAPGASIAMVRLKPAKQYLRDFYLIREGADAYQENDIMMGVAYLYALARQHSMPLVICLGLGTTQGSHSGKSPLGIYLDELSGYSGVAVVVAAGNETGSGGHYRGVTETGETLKDVELRVGDGETGFCAELWAQDVEVYSIGFVSPTGQIVNRIPSSSGENVLNFLLEKTEITVYSGVVSSATGSQLIFIRFKDPEPGIWHIMVYSAIDIRGLFHIWLPGRDFLSGDTAFLRPDPDTTVTDPANAQHPIAVTAFDWRTGGVYIRASRGYSRIGFIKPDIAAPGVSLLGAGTGAAPYVRMDGTSTAAAITAGAAAILLKWGIVDGQDPFMNTSVIRAYFARGAKRNPGLSYPNREFGYGTLDLYQSFLTLRL